MNGSIAAGAVPTEKIMDAKRRKYGTKRRYELCVSGRPARNGLRERRGNRVIAVYGWGGQLEERRRTAQTFGCK